MIHLTFVNGTFEYTLVQFRLAVDEFRLVGQQYVTVFIDDEYYNWTLEECEKWILEQTK